MSSWDMSFTAGVWALLAVSLVVASFQRAVWAVALYMLTFFAAPHLWWWGSDLPAFRYAFWAGNLLLLAVALHAGSRRAAEGRPRIGAVQIAAVGMVINSLFVHVALAVHPSSSVGDVVEGAKFVLLSFLIAWAIQSRRDFRIVLMAIALGAGYIGYEVTINERGSFRGSRLEGVGAPGAHSSNSLASVMLITLPLIGSLFVDGGRREKAMVLLAAPLALNVLLLCNSRGAFLGLIGAGFSFMLVARGPTRKKAIQALALACVALYLLLGDARIFDRFTTTFVGSEDRDQSAASRIEFWQAGLLMIRDYPLGAGGNAFKNALGGRYLSQVTASDEDRSLHNGYLTEATSWGVQGLILKLFFIGGALLVAYRTSARCRDEGRVGDALVGICVIVSMFALLIHSMFGTFLSNEWGYWLVPLLLRYGELYRMPESVGGAAPSRQPTPAGDPRVAVGASAL
jgi:putative inorganic carbon (hco3(-)) transporter